jgi:hypothetical protein
MAAILGCGTLSYIDMMDTKRFVELCGGLRRSTIAAELIE